MSVRAGPRRKTVAVCGVQAGGGGVARAQPLPSRGHGPGGPRGLMACPLELPAPGGPGALTPSPFFRRLHCALVGAVLVWTVRSSLAGESREWALARSVVPFPASPVFLPWGHPAWERLLLPSGHLSPPAPPEGDGVLTANQRGLVCSPHLSGVKISQNSNGPEGIPPEAWREEPPHGY